MKINKKFGVILSISGMLWGVGRVDAQPTSPEDLIVEEVVCSGNERISCEEIQDSLSQKLNEKLNEKEIQNAKLRLGVSGKFETVEISLKKGSEPGKAIVEISVKESPSYFSGLSTGAVINDGRVHGIIDSTLGNRNFLGRGKTLQGSARVIRSFTKKNAEFEGAVRLDYVDPKLGGSSKYYLVSTLGYSGYPTSGISNVGTETVFMNLESGRRVGNFSSLYLGAFAITSTATIVPYFGYGWNTEDHPNFPRTGSSFRTSFGYAFGERRASPYIDIGFRKHWSIQSKSVLSLNLGGNGFMTLSDRYYNFPIRSEYPMISLRYAYDFGRSRGENGKGFIRGYIEPGISSYLESDSVLGPESRKGVASSLGILYSPLVKVGVGFENSIFGTVNLFVSYATEGRL